MIPKLSDVVYGMNSSRMILATSYQNKTQPSPSAIAPLRTPTSRKTTKRKKGKIPHLQEIPTRSMIDRTLPIAVQLHHHHPLPILLLTVLLNLEINGDECGIVTVDFVLNIWDVRLALSRG